MIESREKNGKKLMVWRFKNSEVFPDLFKMEFSVCPGVFCTCMEMEISFKSASMDRPFWFLAELKKCKIAADEEKGKKHLFFKKLVQELDQADWDFLWQQFFARKYECMLQFDWDGDELPEFNEYDVEKLGMVIYQDKFPWDRTFPFAVGDINYQAFDQYCLRSHHDCGEAVVQFVGVRNRKQVHRDKEVPSIELNTRTKNWKPARRISPRLHDHKTLVEELLKKYPDAFDEFSRRHARLRSLYKKFLATERAAGQMGGMVAQKKPSRNAPCPCGSGKKYKKCCGAGVVT